MTIWMQNRYPSQLILLSMPPHLSASKLMQEGFAGFKMRYNIVDNDKDLLKAFNSQAYL